MTPWRRWRSFRIRHASAGGWLVTNPLPVRPAGVPCGRERVCMHVSIGFDMEEAGATVQIDQDIRHMMSDRVSA